MLDRGPSTRADFDALLRTLVGRRIVSVEYCELDYEDGSPAWRHAGAHVDSLDFGLTWKLDDGAPFSFTWGAELAQYGVSIHRAPLRFRSPVRRWDVTERWGSWLRRPIASVATSWMLGFLDEPGVTYPQAVRIELEGASPITISALELREEGPRRMMDHISVFFRDEDVPRE